MYREHLKKALDYVRGRSGWQNHMEDALDSAMKVGEYAVALELVLDLVDTYPEDRDPWRNCLEIGFIAAENINEYGKAREIAKLITNSYPEGSSYYKEWDKKVEQYRLF
ncbi:hypothetical protein [Paenibacillus macquariensis]|uniref:Tetratricopeptide repeat protein n=1 Tax=Paenibacillus macquariensis TaxID=948756 RepID=A0ABY1KEZ3_9BACL|nr:hypothetical protein [Paenibacillus macquariensis]OAB29602.1 hypothetical protein PMSM_23750 [Paenibacillus macquariensis subsp. macquariensis]SIR73575.1 hypothetical protein SAMN05421578_1531 [Paenibacillus macquariensis]